MNAAAATAPREVTPLRTHAAITFCNHCRPGTSGDRPAEGQFVQSWVLGPGCAMVLCAACAARVSMKWELAGEPVRKTPCEHPWG